MQEQIGRYQLKHELARGGAAVVYHALDPASGREVAIKCLRSYYPDSTNVQERFQREIEAMATLESVQGIVPVYDCGIENNRPYLVMRLMRGGSLADKLQNDTLTPNDVIALLAQIAPSLDRAHAKGFVHRDLKPSNILFDDEGGAFLSDFGIAKATASPAQLTETNTLIGTATYMSPEQALGQSELDWRSDLYSLGIVVFELLFHRRPYEANHPIGMAMARLLNPVPTLVGDEQPYQAWFDRALARQSDARFDSAQQMMAELRHIILGPSSQPLVASMSQPHSHRHRRWLPLVVIALLFAAGVLIATQIHLPPDPIATSNAYRFGTVGRSGGDALAPDAQHTLLRNHASIVYTLHVEQSISFVTNHQQDTPRIGFLVTSANGDDAQFVPIASPPSGIERKSLQLPDCMTCVVWSIGAGQRIDVEISTRDISAELGDEVQIRPALERCSDACPLHVGPEAYQLILSD